MNWYYAEDGKQSGPVTDDLLRQLVQSGKIDNDTLVWCEGMPDWAPYGEILPQPTQAPPTPGPASSTGSFRPGVEQTCSECGRQFPADELITLNKTLVCAQCKPLYLQRMAEGVATGGIGGLWREGKKLFTRSETPFPDRCIKCNAPANGFRIKRVLYWHHPACYALILCNLLIYAIVALVIRKKAVLHIGLCEVHRKQRRTAIIACLIGVFGGLALFMASAATDNGWLAIAGLGALLTGIVWGLVWGRTIAATKIENDNVWASGAGRAFLDQLPER